MVVLEEERPTAPASYLTDAFWLWFGGSRAVDAAGQPLVLYHGTSRRFVVFSEVRTGENFPAADGAFFFTPSKAFAEQMADFVAENDEADDRGDATVMMVYLSLKNPLIRDLAGKNVDIDLEIQDAKANGHDGLILFNALDGMPSWPETQYIVFRPEQIKSATSNRGTFDPRDPDITH